MKKTMKQLFALALAVTVCFSQTGMSALASNSNQSFTEPKIELISIEETVEETTEVVEETTEEVATEEVTEIVEETTEEVATEEATEVVEETTEEATTEEATEVVEETTEEVTTEEATEVVEETTEEATTEEATEVVEETTEEETTEEATEPEEEIFPGLESLDELSDEQILNKKELNAQVTAIGGYESGVDYVEGEILVDADTIEEAEKFAAAYNGTLADYNENRKIAKIELADGVTVQQAVNASAVVNTYEKTVILPAAWPNYLAYTFEENVEADMDATVSGFSGYNDKELSYQWHHEYMGSEYAWAEGYTGAGVQVAIIDTGILKTHQDLAKNTVDGKAFIDEVEYSTDNNDYQGHGTHVAGIVAADGNNGLGGSGVAPDAVVRSYRVFGETGGATTWDIIYAVDAAVADGNDVINMSLGGPGYYKPYHQAIKDATKSGVAVFVAAGNENNNGGDVYPANFSEAITIAAINLSGGAATFSNFGNHVDLAFPGVDIYSTYNESTSSYTYMNGTSMATPAAAGAAAVILSANPKALQGKEGKAKVNALVSLMKNNAKKSSSSGMGKGTTYIPKACGLSGTEAKPVAPTFSLAKGTYYSESVSVTITTELGKDIYYSTNGKNPSFKNGVPVNATLYTGPVTVTGARNVTLKAISVDERSGAVSKVASAKYTLMPDPSRVEISTKEGYKGNLTSIAQGKSQTFKTAVYPSYAISTKVKWEVSPADQGVTVSSKGVVKASKNAVPGAYTLTATAVDKKGNPYAGVAQSYGFKVTEGFAINSMELSQTTVEAEAGDVISVKDYLTIKDADGNAITNNEYYTACTVTTSNKKVAVRNENASGIVINCIAPGTAKITVKAHDGSGKKAVLTIKVVSPVEKITIAGANQLAKGKNMTLTSSVAPSTAKNKKLDWTITPAGQGVTVKNGKVTASSKATEGIYTIQASAKDGSGVVSNAVTVQVIGGAITKITVPKNATIFTVPGNTSAPTTYQITPEITGKDGFNSSLITYTSSNPGVATVNQSGYVVAKAAGTTKITVAATDGSKKKATITINVNVPMSGVKIAPKGGATQFVGKGKKVAYGTLVYSDFGTVTNKKVTWESADTRIATVDKNGNVKGKAKGTTTITARAADGCGVYGTYEVTVVGAASYLYAIPYDYTFYTDGFLLTLLFYTDAEILNYTSAYKVEISGGKNASIVTNYLDGIDLFITKSGTYSVKVTLLDGSKKSYTYRFRVTL